MAESLSTIVFLRRLFLLLFLCYHAFLYCSAAPFVSSTSVTGFGSRAFRKSIFSSQQQKQRQQAEDDEKKMPNLWVYLEDNVLWLQETENEDKIICISVDEASGEWMVQDHSDNQKQETKGRRRPPPLDTNSKVTAWIPIEGIFGLYPLPSGILFGLIPKTEHVYSAPPLSSSSTDKEKTWWQIHKVSQVELVHLSRYNDMKMAPLTQTQIKEELRQLRIFRKALREQEFYFIPKENYSSSNTTIVKDMTKTIQQTLLTQVEANDQNWYDSSYDDRFVWNLAAINPILRRYRLNEDHDLERDLLRHVIPLTSAFVGVQSNLTLPTSSSNSVTTYEEVLISRRSRFRAGTRFTRRGADATGAVANFVETEQICLVLSNNSTTNNTVISKLASHVQIRGSIPLRWSSPADVKTYRPRVRIGTDPVAQARALQLHLQETRTKYYYHPDNGQNNETIVFCNLIDSKSDQGRLGRAFDAVLGAVEEVRTNTGNDVTNPAKHVWFDFHAQVKNGKWDRLATLLTELEPHLNSHGYFVAEPISTASSSVPQWNIQKTQHGIIRTNCMDCLDRTNVVQSILGRKVLFEQLKVQDKEERQKKSWSEKVRRKFEKRQQLTLPWEDGEAAHRALWADNADAISRIYAGTPALKRDFTRTGKRTRIGALDDGMNSLQRYYLNNFLDADRQEGMDLLVGFANFSHTNQDPSSSSKQSTRHGLLASLLESKDLNPSLKELGLDESTLDLRWVPGDLQAHFRSKSEDSATVKADEKEPTTNFKFSPFKALKAIDERSTSDLPWWWQIEDKDEDDDKSPNDLLEPHQRHQILTRGQVFGLLFVGINAPMTLAKSVVSLVAVVYLADIVRKDLSSIQKRD